MISVLYNRKDLGGVKDEKRGQKMGILLWGAGYLLGGLAAFAWFTSRPVSLRAEELTRQRRWKPILARN